MITLLADQSNTIDLNGTAQLIIALGAVSAGIGAIWRFIVRPLFRVADNTRDIYERFDVVEARTASLITTSEKNSDELALIKSGVDQLNHRVTMNEEHIRAIWMSMTNRPYPFNDDDPPPRRHP